MIGKKIKYYRLKKGLTTEELAKAIGLTKAAISLYENEEREPSDDICKKIAHALDIPWVALLSRNSVKLEFNHVSFRKKQKASKNDIELLKMDIEAKCADRIGLMNIVGAINFKCFKPKKLSFDDSFIFWQRRFVYHIRENHSLVSSLLSYYNKRTRPAHVFCCYATYIKYAILKK